MTGNRSRRAVALAMTFVSLTVGAGQAAADGRYKKLFIFGDSLSDVGNVLDLSGGATPPPDSYYKGRFTSGPVWAERLAERLDLDPLRPSRKVRRIARKAISYAYGGSTTSSELEVYPAPGLDFVPGLGMQVEEFVEDARGNAPANALYVVWSGANNYVVLPDPSPVQAVVEVGRAVQDIADYGGKHFMVPNLPDIGRSPLAQLPRPGFPDGIGPLLSEVAGIHNDLLLAQLAQLDARPGNEHLKINLIDILATADVLFDSPWTLGFGNEGTGPNSGCLFPNPPNVCPNEQVPRSYKASVFMDEQHVIPQVHSLVAGRVVRSLRAKPTQFPDVEVLLADLLNPARKSFRVRILSSLGDDYEDAFDATHVDPLSLTLGPGRARVVGNPVVRDFNRDGLVDLQVRFRRADAALRLEVPFVNLSGAQLSGRTLIGSYCTLAVPCPPLEILLAPPPPVGIVVD